MWKSTGIFSYNCILIQAQFIGISIIFSFPTFIEKFTPESHRCLRIFLSKTLKEVPYENGPNLRSRASGNFLLTKWGRKARRRLLSSFKQKFIVRNKHPLASESRQTPASSLGKNTLSNLASGQVQELLANLVFWTASLWSQCVCISSRFYGTENPKENFKMHLYSGDEQQVAKCEH